MTLCDASPLIALINQGMDRYRDVPMDLADASLVAIAESLNQRQIFTLDRNFYIYRLWGHQSFEVLP